VLPYIVDMPAKKNSVAKRSSQRQPAKRSSSSGKRQQLKIQSSKVVYKGPVFSVTSDQVKEPTGIVARRDVVHHPGSVVILAVDDSGNEPLVLLERQYRYAAQDYLWELPAGSLDPPEKALTGAKRELLEETGYHAKKWQRALLFYPSPGFLNETMAVYLARELTAGEAQPEEDEVLECKLTPLSRAIEMVLSGEIRDGKTIAGVLWLAQTRRWEPLGKK
jgi:ADP-ribose pyrophosphatase